MSKTRAVRLSDDLDAWLEGYASKRKVPVSDLLRTALQGFREDCERGVPDLLFSRALKPAKKSPAKPSDAAKRKAIEDQAYVEMQAAHRARQAKLNESKSSTPAASKLAARAKAVKAAKS